MLNLTLALNINLYSYFLAVLLNFVYLLQKNIFF